MSDCNSNLRIDLGEVGYGHHTQRFCVRLEIEPLRELIRCAEAAYRVYELLLLDRPGDVFEYVEVVLEAVPTSVADRVTSARKNVEQDGVGLGPTFDGDRLPFKVFDGLFYRSGDDTSAEDDAWLNHRCTAAMRLFAQNTFSMARAAQGQLSVRDHLLRHIAQCVKSGEHPYCYLDRDVARSKSRAMKPNDPVHTASFYAKLAALLCSADLTSVAYRGDGDARVLRMLAAEQRRRAELAGLGAGSEMVVNALVNVKADNDEWGSEIWYFEEGLAHGDLFIEGGGLGEVSIRALLATRRRTPSKFILSCRDEGAIDGFAQETGEGWVLYEAQPIGADERLSPVHP